MSGRSPNSWTPLGKQNEPRNNPIPDDVQLVDFKNHLHIEDVFRLLGILHRGQSEYFASDGLEHAPPSFDLDDYIIHMIIADGQIAGVILSKNSNTFYRCCTIADIVLYRRFRGMGIGRYAIQKIIDIMKADGAKSVNLNVNTRNVYARSLYKKMGFVVCSEFMVKDLTK